MTSPVLPAVCLLAGGRGKRLGTITESVPKPMVEVAGRPFIDWPLMQLAEAGFRRVVLCVGYRGELLRGHVGDGAPFGLDVSYSDDGPELIGTLGAVRKALPLLDDTIPLMYADTYLDIPFAAVVKDHVCAGLPMTMTVIRNDDAWDRSNAVVVGDRVTAYAKNPPPDGASWIDYGFSVFQKEVLLQADGSDLAPLVGYLAASGDVHAWPTTNRFHEIGTPDALHDTANWLSAHGSDGAP